MGSTSSQAKWASAACNGPDTDKAAKGYGCKGSKSYDSKGSTDTGIAMTMDAADDSKRSKGYGSKGSKSNGSKGAGIAMTTDAADGSKGSKSYGSNGPDTDKAAKGYGSKGSKSYDCKGSKSYGSKSSTDAGIAMTTNAADDSKRSKGYGRKGSKDHAFQPVDRVGPTKTNRSPIGFYYPGYESEVDKVYKYCEFGNFWKFNLTVGAENWIHPLEFSCAEGAFQALKCSFTDAKEFRTLSGSQTFRLKNKFLKEGKLNFANSGFASNWCAMKAVLDAKFSAKHLAEILLATNDAFLIEHTPVKGRDRIWANDSDGSGWNWLGFQLMWKRAELKNDIQELEWLGSMIDFKTGEIIDLAQWSELVRHHTSCMSLSGITPAA